jgi:hypothetical protein
MQTSPLSEELRKRQTISRPKIREEFWRYFLSAIVIWGMTGVIINHLIEHAHWAFIDIPAGLLMSTAAICLSVISWIKFRDLVAVNERAR